MDKIHFDPSVCTNATNGFLNKLSLLSYVPTQEGLARSQKHLCYRQHSTLPSNEGKCIQ